MRNFLIIFVCFSALLAVAQSSPKYVPGTILDVVAVKNAAGATDVKPVYDVTVRVKETVYVVRYVAPTGGTATRYFAGLQLPVLIGEDTIKFNDLAGQSFEVPIMKKITAASTKVTK